MNTLRRFRKPRLGLLLCIVYVALGFSGCYQASSEPPTDDSVVTGHSPDANFGSYLTFAIDPTVHVAAVQADDTVETTDADPRMSEGVVNRLSDKLMRRGYNRVLNEEDPDLAVTITAIGLLQSGAVNSSYLSRYYSSYWGFPGWSYYYPYEIHSAYETGSLIIDMADLRNAPKSKPVRTPEPDDDFASNGLAVVWTMIGHKAYLDEHGTSRVSNATQAIDEAFAQSPYLTRE
jgi:hypothetical protein